MRKHLPFLSGLMATLVTILWVSFHSAGGDWIWSETQAKVLYSAIWGFGEFPYFSFLDNGGAYLFQDPQGILSSFTAVLVLLLGPVSGVRWAVVVLGLMGFSSCYVFLKEKLGREAALFSASAWTLSLGFFWHIAVGHDMFAWGFLLPLFLLLVEKFALQPALRNSILLGLAIGVFVLGPSYQALFYFVLPGCFIYFSILLFSRKVRVREVLRLGLLSLMIATLIAFPKLESWLHLPIGRGQDFNDGVISLKDAVQGLFVSARASFSGVRIQGIAKDVWLGIFEVNSALFPPASVLAFLGLATGWRSPRPGRKPGTLDAPKSLWVFAVAMIVFGIFFSCSLNAWSFFKAHFLVGARVPSRFLLLSAFGLAILSGIGFRGLLAWTGLQGKKLQRARFRILLRTLPWVAWGLLFLFCGNWISRAHQSGVLTAQAAPLLNYPLIASEPPRLSRDGDLLSGRIAINGYCPVGSGCLRMDEAGYPADALVSRVMLPSSRDTGAALTMREPERLSVSHTSISLRGLKPGETLPLFLRFPFLGFETGESRAELLTYSSGLVLVRNLSDHPIEHWVLRVRPPFSTLGVLVSLCTLALSLVFLRGVRFGKSRATSRRTK